MVDNMNVTVMAINKSNGLCCGTTAQLRLSSHTKHGPAKSVTFSEYFVTQFFSQFHHLT